MKLSSDRYEELNREVLNLLQTYEVYSYPLDLFSLLDRMQILSKTYSQTHHAAIIQKEISRDALTASKKGYQVGYVYIAYDESMSTERIRFSIAHEIAHIWLEHPSNDEPYESEANYFASYLLAPLPLVKKWCTPNAYEVAGTFQISFSAASNTLEKTWKRIRCQKPLFDYEYQLIDLCTYEGGEFY